MPYANEHSARVKDPGDFIDDSFRRKNIDDGVDIIIGKLKNGDGKMVTQAYRFDAEKFSVRKAKKWLADHDIKYISFEAATEEDNETINIQNKMNRSGFQVKSSFEIKDVDEKKGIVTGYASIFNNIDSDSDMVMPGAFAKTLEERGPAARKARIKHLWQHDSWNPIAIPQMLEEDKKGLYFESVFGKDQFSQDKLQQHIDGIITELSIGYNVIRQEDVMENEKVTHRKLLELKLWEYSSVTWGANSLTEVISAKGEVKDVIANLDKRLDSLNRGLKNGKYTDESCEQFENEIEKIKAIIKSLNIETAPEPASTRDVVAPTITNKQILETILNAYRDGR